MASAEGGQHALAAKTRRELARGTVELALLAMLGSGPRYGYELLTELNDRSGGVPELKEGTLYPLLHRLEDAGVVVATWDAQGRTPPRKYYALSEAGRHQLALLRDEWQRLVTGMGRVLEGNEVPS